MSQDVAQKPRFSRGMFYLAVIGLVILGIAGFIFSQRSDGGAVNIAYGEPDPLPVSVAIIHIEDSLQFSEQFTGLVAARRSSALGFETGGRIVDITVDTGDQVKAGQTLARLDVRTLKANLAAAKAQIAEAEASLQFAQATVERQTKLQEKGLLSTQRFDEAEAQANAAMARLSAATAQADALKVRIELSALNAPYAGTITRRMADEGVIAGPGQAVLQLVEAGAPEASIGLPQKVADRLNVGETYPLNVGDVVVPATLRTLTNVIDANQRTITAVFDLKASDDIRPGAVARLELNETLPVRGFWIPVSAMTEADRGLWAVYAVHTDDQNKMHAEKRLVDILHAESNRAFVRGAMEDGEMFVVNGLHRIAPGQLVAPHAIEGGFAGTER